MLLLILGAVLGFIFDLYLLQFDTLGLIFPFFRILSTRGNSMLTICVITLSLLDEQLITTVKKMRN